MPLEQICCDRAVKHNYQKDTGPHDAAVFPSNSSSFELKLLIKSTMSSSANSTLPTVYESYGVIAPCRYAGKLQGKVVRLQLF
jgi:hypothetical protein